MQGMKRQPHDLITKAQVLINSLDSSMSPNSNKAKELYLSCKGLLPMSCSTFNFAYDVFNWKKKSVHFLIKLNLPILYHFCLGCPIHFYS